MSAKPFEKIILGSEVGKSINCSSCKKPGTTNQFITLRGRTGDIYLCPECRASIKNTFAQETQNPRILLAILGGFLGGILGGIVWFWVTVYTHWEIGYLALALGYVVAYGVHYGSGKKRNHQLQIISAFITGATIFITEKCIFDYFTDPYFRLNMWAHLSSRYFWQSLTDPVFLHHFASPIAMLIYIFGIYFAYRFCKPRTI